MPPPSDTATITTGPDPVGTEPPRRPPGPSVRPALVPVGIAALVLLIGGIGAILTSSGSAQPSPSHGFPSVRAAGIKAVAARPALTPIVTAGQPPSDILNVVPLPTGAQVKKGSQVNNTIGLYDHSLSFTIPASEQKVITFYLAELRALKWQLVSQGPPPHGAAGYQIVGQHPSSDGYEWEVGVIISPTTFGAGSGTAATSAAEATPFTLRLFAVADD